jgi:hypothetical protein
MRTIDVRRQLGGVVRCACQKYRRAVRSFGNQNDCVQLHSVTHWNHDFTANIVEPVISGFKLLWCLVRQSLRLR